MSTTATPDVELTEDSARNPYADDPSVCHIEVGDGKTAYCGYQLNGPGTCKLLFNGESVCPSCHLPTCPTCSAMSGLNEQLIDGGGT